MRVVKSIVILGAGESGTGAALLAKAKGHEVFLSDRGTIGASYKQQLIDNAIDFEEGKHSIGRIHAADIIVKSPGIPDTVPFIVEAVERGIPVISEIEFAYEYTNAKLIAITGTNGKTTTTLLTYHLLKEAGFNVGVGGNIGNSFAAMVIEDKYDVIVLEISSFQLDGIIKFNPDIAVLLNITPDHLDRYENDFQQYVNAKFKITQNQTKNECLIYFGDSIPISEEIKKRNIEASLFALSLQDQVEEGGYLDQDHLSFNITKRAPKRKFKIPVDEIALIGKHNMVNSMAAVTASMFMGAPLAAVMKGLKNFKNAAHRLELVSDIAEVRFINDSKATNVDAVFYALEGITNKMVWIVGGTDKGNDYTAIKPLVKEKVKEIVCLGVDNSRIKNAFGDLSIPIVETTTTDDAVKVSFSAATKGDVVLLSPACASFDLFKNYEDRGDQFKASVMKFKDQFNQSNTVA